MKDILVEKDIAYQDAEEIPRGPSRRREATIRPTPGVRRACRSGSAFDAGIRRTFGEDVFAQIQNAPSVTGAQQTFLEALTLRLSYSATPLSASQADRLVEVYLQPRSRSPGPRKDVPDEIIVGAEAILLPEQMAALQQLRREQEGRTLPAKVVIRPPAAK